MGIAECGCQVLIWRNGPGNCRWCRSIDSGARRRHKPETRRAKGSAKVTGNRDIDGNVECGGNRFQPIVRPRTTACGKKRVDPRACCRQGCMAVLEGKGDP